MTPYSGLAEKQPPDVGAGDQQEPDGRGVDLVYRLPQAAELRTIVEEDPYWTAGAWTGYAPRSFTVYVEPWEQVPIVLDGSRRATVVEGRVAEPDMAQVALIEMRGAGRVAFGGFFEDGETFALTKGGDAAEALGWFKEAGFWAPESLRARPLLWVL